MDDERPEDSSPEGEPDEITMSGGIRLAQLGAQVG